VVSKDESKLIEYLAQLVADDTYETQPFHVAANVEVKFQRSKLDIATKVQMSKDSDAVKITLTDEDIRDRYPWDYGQLTRALMRRYSDFSANQTYHTIRKRLAHDAKFARNRYLDPGNSRSLRKTFFNPNIVAEFDSHYTVKPTVGAT
jgi:hypothetical protein